MRPNGGFGFLGHHLEEEEKKTDRKLGKFLVIYIYLPLVKDHG